MNLDTNWPDLSFQHSRKYYTLCVKYIVLNIRTHSLCILLTYLYAIYLAVTQNAGPVQLVLRTLIHLRDLRGKHNHSGMKCIWVSSTQ